MLIKFLLILIIFVAINCILIIVLYNKIIRNKNQVNNAFSCIDIHLKKRRDLIPNLVAVAQNYMIFEQSILTDITRMRSKVVSRRGTENYRLESENEIYRMIDKLIVILNSYPELKADNHFIQLQQSLNEIEEQISAARRFYNTAVTEYNNTIEVFPNSSIASVMNCSKKQLFIALEKDRYQHDVRQLLNS